MTGRLRVKVTESEYTVTFIIEVSVDNLEYSYNVHVVKHNSIYNYLKRETKG